jgi:hypothetical protein
MESLLLKSFKVFVVLLLITGCTPERNNPFDPMGEDSVWVNLYRPEAITILPDGNLCVANKNGFTIFNTEGDSIDFFYPVGRVNGLDVGFGRIIGVYGGSMKVFALDGTFEKGIGGCEYNSQPYSFLNLTGIYANDTNLYLIDSNVVIKMNSSFECVARWKSSEDKALYDIFYSEGYLYATLKNSIGVQVFDTSGRFITEESNTYFWTGDECFSRGITGDNSGNLFFFTYSVYFSSLDSTYHIDDSRICLMKEMNCEGVSGEFIQEFLGEDDLVDVMYYEGYLYVTEYWDNSMRKLWLDGYIP